MHPDKLPFLRAFDAFGVAQKYGRECDFVENYGACQWGMGISAGTDEGLKTMLTMSGLGHKWEEVQSVINSESPEEKFSKWEIYASENRDYITNHGLWGVPCIRYGDVLLFGQDKLWAIKHVLECKSSGSSRLHARPTQGWEYNERILAAIKQYGGMQ